MEGIFFLVYNVNINQVIFNHKYFFSPERADYFLDQSVKGTLYRPVRTRHLCQPLTILCLSLHYPKNSNIPELRNPLLIPVSTIDCEIVSLLKQYYASTVT